MGWCLTSIWAYVWEGLLVGEAHGVIGVELVGGGGSIELLLYLVTESGTTELTAPSGR